MTSVLIGLTAAKLPLDVLDMNEYVQYGLKRDLAVGRFITVIAMKTLCFLGHVFQLYEYCARLRGRQIGNGLSIGIRAINVILNYANLIENFDHDYGGPKVLKIVSTLIASIGELFGFIGALYYSKLHLSDEQLAKMTGYKILIKKEWISDSTLVSTYQVLTKERVIQAIASLAIFTIVEDALYLSVSASYWIFKKLFPPRQEA
jgi:hypothetical protein